MENKELFFCYSNRLHLFLEAFSTMYINKGVNNKTNQIYYVYKKTDKLNKLLTQWNNMKNIISLEESSKKSM